jgi:hypothetical protein
VSYISRQFNLTIIPLQVLCVEFPYTRRDPSYAISQLPGRKSINFQLFHHTTTYTTIWLCQTVSTVFWNHASYPSLGTRVYLIHSGVFARGQECTILDKANEKRKGHGVEFVTVRGTKPRDTIPWPVKKWQTMKQFIL